MTVLAKPNLSYQIINGKPNTKERNEFIGCIQGDSEHAPIGFRSHSSILAVDNGYRPFGSNISAEATSLVLEPKKDTLCCILDHLDDFLLAEIFEHVDQYDLVNLLMVCKAFYPHAIKRLYKRVTVTLNSEFPIKYKTSKEYIQENGIKYMDSSLILSCYRLLLFFDTLRKNEHLVQKIKFFVFDKCHSHIEVSHKSLMLNNLELNYIQHDLIDFFGSRSTEITFLHVTFIDLVNGIATLTKFLNNDNIRNRIFKLFVTSLPNLYKPQPPPALTNLFLMLDELELMHIPEIDLSCPPYDIFNSLFTLTCSTNNQFGFEILKKLKLINNDSKLKLKGLTLFHVHKKNLLVDDELSFGNILANDPSAMELVNQQIEQLDKTLSFQVVEDKIDMQYLKNLYLKIDCNEQRSSHCNCFTKFFEDLAAYAFAHDGLPNLVSLELELFPNLEWLRPHQLLDTILTPFGNVLKNLRNLSRLTLDFSTPGFKMFDNTMGMTSMILNRLNERLMEAFFLIFVSSDHEEPRMHLKTLQLPDFLTSFVYYKPSFYESLLHTCRCWGCQLVLEMLKKAFHPLHEEESDDENQLDIQSTYYILIGFILGKLQADREVCVPIKQQTFDFSNYPIYKGQPHTLHSHFHKGCNCHIERDPQGKHPLNIDNLVTTYIVHQLRPITDYLALIFDELETLMIHGIYYENTKDRGLVPIYDNPHYPRHFLKKREYEITHNVPVDLPFGEFRKN